MDGTWSSYDAADWAQAWRFDNFENSKTEAILFPPLETDLPLLRSDEFEQLHSDGLDLPLGELKHITADAAIASEALLPVEEVVTKPLVPVTEAITLEADIWRFEDGLEREQASGGMRAWESFGNAATALSSGPHCLSEAGARIFDAALLEQVDDQTYTETLSHDLTLKALCNLAVGRSSALFRWDSLSQQFIMTLKSLPISGLSRSCSDAVIQVILNHATRHRRLTEFSDGSDLRLDCCTAIVALRTCIGNMLDAIDSVLTDKLRAMKSLLQLQNLLSVPIQLLECLCELVDSVRHCEKDEDVICVLSDMVYSMASTSHPLCKILDIVLSRTCEPWLERLLTDVGLGTQQFQNNWSNSSVEDIDDKDEEQKLSFVSADDYKVIRETKLTLRLLRRHCESEKSVDRYNSSSQAVKSKPANSYDRKENYDIIAHQCPFDENLIWMDDSTRTLFFAQSDAQMNQLPLANMDDSDPCLQSVKTALQEAIDGKVVHWSDTQTNLIMDPLRDIRQALFAQNISVNATLLTHVFQGCQLRKHVGVLKQFQLFGNGEFVSHLSTVLFSGDTQSAERRKGNVPTAKTIGLRLGQRDGQRWPPASSELRLTLTGLLSETYETRSTESRSTTTRLPGDLSFSIRELPEEAIERVMDVSSIHALDFLKLAYTAPSPLDSIFTPSSMNLYDDIFCFELKLLRALHMTTIAQKHMSDISHAKNNQQSGEVSSTIVRGMKMTREAHHIVTTLMSYTMELGIQMPWQTFSRQLDAIETTITKSNGTMSSRNTQPVIGINGLREIHDHFQEVIRTRLFLRHRHEKLRLAIEALLGAILKSCTLVVAAIEDGIYNDNSYDNDDDNDNDDDGEKTQLREGYSSLRSFVTGFLRLLDELVTAPRKGTVSLAVEDDVEAWRILLLRLNWNGFYGDFSV